MDFNTTKVLLQNRTYRETNFAIQNNSKVVIYWYMLFSHWFIGCKLLERKFWLSTSYCICVTKVLLKREIFLLRQECCEKHDEYLQRSQSGKTSMSKGALVKKFTNLNSFLIIKQGNINKRIMSSIYINKTKNIGFSSTAKILIKEDESNGRLIMFILI